MTTIRERIQAKIADIEEQIEALRTKQDVTHSVAAPHEMTHQIQFQRERIDMLRELEDLDEAGIMARAKTHLADWLAMPSLEHRMKCDLCRYALGAENLEDLLLKIEGVG